MRGNAIRRELRGIIVQAGMATGLILGFLWALEHPAKPKPCPGTEPGSVGECFSTGLTASLMPYLLAMGGGILAGGLLGLLLSRLIRDRPARSGRASSSAEASPGSEQGRWIRARYSGRCVGCECPIEPGDRIYHLPGQTRCVSCGTKVERDPATKRGEEHADAP